MPARSGSAHLTCLLNRVPPERPFVHQFGILFVPRVLAGAERTEFAGEGFWEIHKILGVDVKAHKHVVPSNPALADDLSHGGPPSSSPLALQQRQELGKVPGPNDPQAAAVLLAVRHWSWSAPPASLR